MITEQKVMTNYGMDRDAKIESCRRELTEKGYVSSVWVSGNLRESNGKQPHNKADQVKRLRKYAEKAPEATAIALIIDCTVKVWYPREKLNYMLSKAGCTARVPE